MFEKQLNEVLKRMKDDQVINKDIYERIKSTGTIIPRLHSLPKIHKLGLPLRLMPDMSGSPYHSTAN